MFPVNVYSYKGVLETGSAKTGSAIDVNIDDAGSILNFRTGFSLWFSAVMSQLRPSCPLGFGGIGGRFGTHLRTPCP